MRSKIWRVSDNGFANILTSPNLPRQTCTTARFNFNYGVPEFNIDFVTIHACIDTTYVARMRGLNSIRQVSNVRVW